MSDTDAAKPDVSAWILVGRQEGSTESLRVDLELACLAAIQHLPLASG